MSCGPKRGYVSPCVPSTKPCTLCVHLVASGHKNIEANRYSGGSGSSGSGSGGSGSCSYMCYTSNMKSLSLVLQTPMAM